MAFLIKVCSTKKMKRFMSVVIIVLDLLQTKCRFTKKDSQKISNFPIVYFTGKFLSIKKT